MSEWIRKIGGGNDKPYKLNGNVLEYQNLNIFVWKQRKNIVAEEVMGMDAIFIFSTNNSFTRTFIKKLRSSTTQELYLKPVYILNWTNPEHEPIINQLIDGVLHSLDEVVDVADEIKNLNERCKRITENKHNNFEDIILHKTLSFLVTRGINDLFALPYYNSGVSYVYPILSVNFKRFEEYKVLEILEYAEKKDIFKSKHEDKVYLCIKCKNSFLNYRESCPKCSSTDLSTTELIHHFKCAYIGPESDFNKTNNTQLTCPKCSSNLKHIGIDYDKPSVVHSCNNCYHEFQDLSVKAKCMSCGHENDVEHLISKEIKHFYITKKGELSVVSGFEDNIKEYDLIEGTVDEKVFTSICNLELERNKINKNESSYALLSLQNSFELLNEISSDEKQLVVLQCIQFIKKELRIIDTIYVENISNIHILISEINTDNCKTIFHKIQLLLNLFLDEKYPKIKPYYKATLNDLKTHIEIQNQLKSFEK